MPKVKRLRGAHSLITPLHSSHRFGPHTPPLQICGPAACGCSGSYAEIKERFAKEAALRKKDKLSYRYPRGESYLDVIQRLEPLVQEIERHRESLLIVGHQGVLRMIYAFYAGMEPEFIVLRYDDKGQPVKANARPGSRRRV